MKSWWKKIKAWLLEKVKAEAHKAIARLDKWEPKLAEIISERLNPDEKATQIVDYLQGQLHKLVDKISDGSWVAKVMGIKSKLHDAVDSLDKYEDDLAGIMKKHLNADEKAKLVVDYIQAWLGKWVEKIID